MHAEDIGLSPKYVMHDRDRKFTREFDEIVKSSGAKVKKTTIQSPNLQAHVERAIQTLKHEVLNHFVIRSERHLNHICSEAVRWYNTERGHSARGNVPPAWESPPEEVQTIRPSEVVCTTRSCVRRGWVYDAVGCGWAVKALRATGGVTAVGEVECGACGVGVRRPVASQSGARLTPRFEVFQHARVGAVALDSPLLSPHEVW